MGRSCSVETDFEARWRARRLDLGLDCAARGDVCVLVKLPDQPQVRVALDALQGILHAQARARETSDRAYK